ncbi:MAG: hypothetical protein GY861_15850 [bacterium]|nr:hypothetical protein [bacterium]
MESELINRIFFDIGIVIVVATVFAYFAKITRQPRILGYIIAGVLIGPMVFKLITNHEIISTLSEIGIAFLLFIVGLEIDFRRMKDVGTTALVVAFFQMLLSCAFGYFIAKIWFDGMAAFYIALVVAFSSTMIVIKLLADKKELDTLHGRIVLGILLIQDVIAIFILALIPNLNNPSIDVMLRSVGYGAAFFILLFIIARFLLPPFFRSVARSPELLFLSAVSWCFVVALFADIINYSIAIGAFLAGVSLASSPYSLEITSRVKSLRDFFATIFFVSLGMQIAFTSIGKIILPIVVLSIIAVLGKPFIIFILMNLFQHKKRTAFLTSITLAQVSEFSLIIVALGFSEGHISQDIVSLTAIVAVITITLTSYFIKYDQKIYSVLSKHLAFFESISGSTTDLQYLPKEKPEVVMCGYNRIGYSIYDKLKNLKKQVLIVDFNPELIKRLIKERAPCLYGDVGDLEVIEKLNLQKIEMLISTIPTIHDTMLLIQKTKEVNKKAIIIVTANHVDEALSLYDAGADYVVLPHFLGGEHVSFLLEDFTSDLNKILVTKLRHIEELHKRKELGHEHPAHH